MVGGTDAIDDLIGTKSNAFTRGLENLVKVNDISRDEILAKFRFRCQVEKETVAMS